MSALNCERNEGIDSNAIGETVGLGSRAEAVIENVPQVDVLAIFLELLAGGHEGAFIHFLAAVLAELVLHPFALATEGECEGETTVYGVVTRDEETDSGNVRSTS